MIRRQGLIRSLHQVRRWACGALASMALALSAAGTAGATGAVGAGTAGASDPTLAVQDDRGQAVRLSAPPRRIVSLLPSLTEAVAVLGAEDRLVGVDRHSNWPLAVQKLPRLGGLDEIPTEAILALKPDLVLASISTRGLDRLESLGVPVLRLRSDTHDDVRRSLQVLGQVLQRPQQAGQLWSRMQAELDAAAARVPAALQGRSVYFELSGGSYAAGAASFLGQTISRLGLLHVAPAALGPFPKLNPEFVVRQQPAVLMGPQREVLGMPARPGWSGLEAVRHQRWCAFAPDAYELLIRPGPRLGAGAALVADCLEQLGKRTP